jgi:hypothetical protein
MTDRAAIYRNFIKKVEVTLGCYIFSKNEENGNDREGGINVTLKKKLGSP